MHQHSRLQGDGFLAVAVAVAVGVGVAVAVGVAVGVSCRSLQYVCNTCSSCTVWRADLVVGPLLVSLPNSIGCWWSIAGSTLAQACTLHACQCPAVRSGEGSEVVEKGGP